MEYPARRSLSERMMGAALIQRDVYAEVEEDTGATPQAAIVVGIAAIAAAIGGAAVGPAAIIGGLISAYIGWLVWSAVTYLIGDKLLGGTATWGELLRALGFAQTPAVLLVLALIPLLGWLVTAVVAVWLLIAAIVALSEALDVGVPRAILTAVLGWLAFLVLRALGWLVGLA